MKVTTAGEGLQRFSSRKIHHWNRRDVTWRCGGCGWRALLPSISQKQIPTPPKSKNHLLRGAASRYSHSLKEKQAHIFRNSEQIPLLPRLFVSFRVERSGVEESPAALHGSPQGRGEIPPLRSTAFRCGRNDNGGESCGFLCHSDRSAAEWRNLLLACTVARKAVGRFLRSQRPIISFR